MSCRSRDCHTDRLTRPFSRQVQVVHNLLLRRHFPADVFEALVASTIDDISLIDRAVIPPLDDVPCIIPAQRHCDGRVPVAEEDQRAL